jgi:hypothetical protein
VRSNVRRSVACELARAREERKAALTCNHGALLIACEDAKVKCSQVDQVKPRAEDVGLCVEVTPATTP